MLDTESLNQIVSGAVIAALEDKAPALLRETVQKLLAKEVSARNGGEPGYNDTKTTMLEFIAGQRLEFLVSQTVSKWIEAQAPTITEQVNAALAGGAFGAALVASLQEAVSTYRFDFNLQMTPQKD